MDPSTALILGLLAVGAAVCLGMVLGAFLAGQGGP